MKPTKHCTSHRAVVNSHAANVTHVHVPNAKTKDIENFRGLISLPSQENVLRGGQPCFISPWKTPALCLLLSNTHCFHGLFKQESKISLWSTPELHVCYVQKQGMSYLWNSTFWPSHHVTCTNRPSTPKIPQYEYTCLPVFIIHSSTQSYYTNRSQAHSTLATCMYM